MIPRDMRAKVEALRDDSHPGGSRRVAFDEVLAMFDAPALVTEAVCACRSGTYDPATHEKCADCRIRERHEANERKRSDK